MPHSGPVEECTKLGTRKWVKCDVTILHPIGVNVYSIKIMRVTGHFGLIKREKTIKPIIGAHDTCVYVRGVI